MTTTSDKLPMVRRADWVSGPQQGRWTYKEYAALPTDNNRYEVVNGVLICHQRPVDHIKMQHLVASYYAPTSN